MNEYLAEQWKGIVGYPDYEVSTHGRVQKVVSSRYKKVGELIACTLGENGRRGVCLGTGRKDRRFFPVSNLVAITFLGPRPDGYQVHHIDKDASNDWLYNLEYISMLDHHKKHTKEGSNNGRT